ncbi:membrane protein [Bacteroidia bacterium]|nr:membrane protein [Bacteroidia bacterium]
MKKIIFIVVAAATIFAGCDIERLPQSSVSAETIANDPMTYMEPLLNGAYAQMKLWSDAMHRCGEYAGDNIMIRGSSTDAFYEFISYARTPANSRLSTMWNYSYKAIAQTSNILKMIAEGQSAEIDSKLAECYFMRGISYFYLCRAFGRPYYQAVNASSPRNLGVPIVNGTPDDVFGALPDRSTVKDTYEQAIGDLKKSIALFGDYPDRGNSYASKYAAQALLSRIYLYMSGTYDSPNTEYAQLAIDYADEVINSDKFSLLPRADFMRYNTIDPDDNKESIYVVRRKSTEFSGYDHYYNFNGMYAVIGGMGWGEMYASAKYIALLDETGRNFYYSTSTRAVDKSKVVDARAAFIEPQYASSGDNNKGVFRFIKNVYNADGVQTNFNYEQLDTCRHEGALACRSMFVITRTAASVTPVVRDTTFIYHEMTAIDAEHGIYSVNYHEYVIDNKGTTADLTDDEVKFVRDQAISTGYIDQYVNLNRVYPMFYIVKCSREGEESHLHSPVITRLAEMYLNKAEASAKLGNYSAALTALNEVRTRSLPNAAYSSLDVGNAAERIDKERTLELAFQAERSYDVYRNGQSLTRKYPGPHLAMDEILPTDYRVTYFIPQAAIEAYPAGSTLSQNPTSN